MSGSLLSAKAIANGDLASNGVIHHRNGSLNNNEKELSDVSSDQDHVNLKKRVGLLSGVGLIVGTMIGKFVSLRLRDKVAQNDRTSIL